MFGKHCRYSAVLLLKGALTKMPKNAKYTPNTTPTTTSDVGATGGSSYSKLAAVNKKTPVTQHVKDGSISISIQVKPGAKSNSITGISDEAVSIQIAAPPVDGEANIAIIKYFAELLKVKKSDLSLKGGKSRQKTVTISPTTPSLTVDGITQLLSAEVPAEKSVQPKITKFFTKK